MKWVLLKEVLCLGHLFMSSCIFIVSYSYVLLLCAFSLFGFELQLLTLCCAWFLDVGVFATLHWLH
jgi:hypothetical protein